MKEKQEVESQNEATFRFDEQLPLKKHYALLDIISEGCGEDSFDYMVEKKRFQMKEQLIEFKRGGERDGKKNL
jgi:hypothetical protein